MIGFPPGHISQIKKKHFPNIINHAEIQFYKSYLILKSLKIPMQTLYFVTCLPHFRNGRFYCKRSIVRRDMILINVGS